VLWRQRWYPVAVSRAWPIALGVVCALVWRPVDLWADPLRVALVGAPEPVPQAVRVVLQPWNVDLIVIPEQSDIVAAEQSDIVAAEQSDIVAKDIAMPVVLAHIATERDVQIVVLFLGATGGDQRERYTVWVYDVSDGALEQRQIFVPRPLLESDAAAVALSIKTMLRNHSVVRASTGREHQDRSLSAPSVPPRRTYEVHRDAALIRGTSDAGMTAPAEPNRKAQPAIQDVDSRVLPNRLVYVAVAITPQPAQSAGAELRALAGGAWYIGNRPDGRSYGLHFEIAGGTGVSLYSRGLNGRLRLSDLRLAVRYRQWLQPRFYLTLSAGGGIRVVRIRGTIDQGQTAVSDWRWTPTTYGRVEFSIPIIGNWHLGLSLEASYNFRQQRYLLYGEPLARIPTFHTCVATMFKRLW